MIFDEAHRAARLKLIPTMAKECRKYGLSFVVASQEAKDFDSIAVYRRRQLPGTAGQRARRQVDGKNLRPLGQADALHRSDQADGQVQGLVLF
jgi:hypothetical protein